MAQGNMKTKVRLPQGAKQKQKHQKKPLGLKKGVRQFAPKKTKHVEAAKLKKTLEKQIKGNIERDVMLKAASVEPKNFKILQTSSSGESSKTKS